jgi:hypothetical protein
MSTWNEPASLIFIFSSLSRLCRMITLQVSEEEGIRKRKESLSNRLIVKEWPVESNAGYQDIPTPSGEANEAQPPQSPRINSSSASCAMGSEDCDSLTGEEEIAGCAICLSSFKPQQLVCESNNTSCRHVFHKDCMVDWLIKYHDSCPMCREIYLLKTTV